MDGPDINVGRMEGGVAMRFNVNDVPESVRASMEHVAVEKPEQKCVCQECGQALSPEEIICSRCGCKHHLYLDECIEQLQGGSFRGRTDQCYSHNL